MKNKINILIFLILVFFTSTKVLGEEQFNFDVTEIQIIDNGNIFIGKNKGTASTNDGVEIKADEFEYDKKLNLLSASGDVVVRDQINNYVIYSEEIIYDKNKELISTKKKSKAIIDEKKINIVAKNFKYNRKSNLISASGDVVVRDQINNYVIYSEEIIYDKNKELISTKKKSKAVNLNDDTVITANDFEYFRSLNIISAYKNVKIDNKKKQYFLSSNFIKYFIKDEKVFSEGNSKILNLINQTELIADNFSYDISEDIIIADKNVIVENKIKNYKILSSKITYDKNSDKIYAEGETLAEIKSKYLIKSKNITFLQNLMELFSENKVTIEDNHNIYSASNFRYNIKSELLKGEEIIINSNYKKPKSDKYYFANGMINLKEQNFIAADTEVKLHKGIFDNLANDPRIVGKSSIKNDEIIILNKAKFTSCKKNNDDCPPWVIQAKEISHDQKKKEIHYKDAVLKVYDFPVMYFPKFFHPDPSVKRRSGVLKPVVNESNILGSSLTIPYFHVLSDESDLTFTPSIFDTGSNMLQSEFRKVGKNSNVLINFGHVRDYKSALQNKKKNTSYLFSKINYDLNLSEYDISEIRLNIEKVTNDNFLKIFDSNIHENTTSLKPTDNSTMSSSLELTLNNYKHNLTVGISSYEDLQKKKTDEYQYVLPYYDFNKTIFPNFIEGSLNLNSNGSNNLNNTNQVTTKVTNNLSYSSIDKFTKSGLKNNFNINLKNLNSVGKNVSGYKSSPQMELSTLFEANTSLPLKKKTNTSLNFLTPKFSARFNPGDMKNHSSSNNDINVGNIFSIDRFGLGDSYESGKSLTFGVDYRKETLSDINKFFDMKLASVIRDEEENLIPNKTTLNKKTSNIFGSITTNYLENLEFSYNFALANNLNEIEYNDLNTKLSLGNFSTNFNFIKSINEMGDEDTIENTSKYKFNENNNLSFNIRRNRKINLTEFYDLVYEYKNDCLIAGIKYKKTYYEDKDLKPVEDLLFTVTFVPLTTYEHSWDGLK